MVTPEKFCESMHLCKKGMKISLPTREGTCGLCHHVVVEILIMLKDPNMQVITIFHYLSPTFFCVVLLCTMCIL
jgi:saposin